MRINNMKTLSLGALAAAALIVTACGEGSSDSSGASGGSGPTGSTGIAGSTARMVIVDDFLYAIAENQIQLFTISTPSAPAPWVKVTVAWDIQTLFPYKAIVDPAMPDNSRDYLLVGAADGIHILDNSDPASPYPVGDLTHARTIDPVVANAGYAYVTLKNDPQSGIQVQDQMNVVDLSDVLNPQLIKVIDMQSPEGLATIDNRLFVCDGRAGIKQFNLDNPADPQIVDTIVGVDCNDVIVTESILYAITDNSLQQYDYSMSPPALLSIIETETMSRDALSKTLNGKLHI